MLALVGLLLLLAAKVMKKEDCSIMINDDPEKTLKIPGNTTLLSALVDNGVLIPSACGGKGACGACKCKVNEGGGSVLPTELTHLTRKQKNDNIRLACQLKVKQDLKMNLPESIFNIKKYSATVVSNDNVATFIKQLTLQLDEGQILDFNAGAYIQIDIPPYEALFKDFNIAATYKPAWDRFKFWNLKSKGLEPVFRAYSLANPPSEKETLKFTIRIATPPPGVKDVPPGVGSSYVFHLKPGDKVTLSGPYGDFFVKDTDREMCFIGGGAGMAPMRCHILNQLETVQTKRKMTFWYGTRSRAEMFYDEEFTQLDNKYDNFSYHVVMSDPQPEDNWTGFVGYVHNILLEQYLSKHEDPTEIEYYLCGPPIMIQSIENMLYDQGVESEMIAYDKF